MSPWRRRARHLRFGVQTLFAAGVILLALVVGVMQLALPWIASHPERIGSFLSERLGKPVAIDQVQAHWERNGPLLSLHGVRIGAAQSDQSALLIAQAELKINFFPWLYRNARWNEFRLSGLDLHLSRDAAGVWQVHGLGAADVNDKQTDPSALFDLGALVLSNLRVQIDDASSGRQLRLGAEEVRLINSGGAHRVLARIHRLESPAQSVDAVIEYNSDDRTGEAYVGGKAVDLAAILNHDPVSGGILERGTGAVQLWAWWNDDHVTEARAEVALDSVLLDTKTVIALDDKRQIAPRVSFDRIAFGARWQRKDSGWVADVSDLELAQQGRKSEPAILQVEKIKKDDAANAEYRVQAQAVELDAPASVVMLTDAVPEEWRRWLYAANPDGIVHNVTLRYTGTDDFDVDAQISGTAWHALDKQPGIDGLSGTILGDQDAIALQLPTHTAVSVYEPHVFRQPLEFSELSGSVVAYRGDAAWRLETDALTFDNARYGGELVGAMDIHDDGSRPSLDVSAVIRHGEVPASHLFWPINIMPPAAVGWLDRALDSGHIANARAVFHGDLDDWPFRNFAGRFEARAELTDMRVKYLPDWPAAEHVHADADFVNTGLHVDASAGQSLGNRITTATADIGDLGEPLLELKLGAQGAGRDLLGFVKATPIGADFAPQLLGVDVGGQGKVDFQLHLPIKHSEQRTLSGTVELSDADLADAKYNLRLTKANGKARFSDHGFSADELAVRMEDRPATFSLAVGAFTTDAKHVVEANLGADVAAQTVLAYAPVLEAYAEHIAGNAHWNVAFAANASPATAQHLTVTSDLRGVSVALPAPLNKAADTATPMQLILGLPFNGGSIDFKLGDVLRMHGHLAADKSPFAARVTFGGDSTEPLPKSGFLIGGNTPQLDISGWMDFAASNNSGGDNGLLAGIDLHADQLSAYDRDFGAATFNLTPATDALDLKFTGAKIDGSLQVPTVDLRQRGVTAQFARLYWPETPEAVTTAAAGENPAALPPLHIHIGDFHLGTTSFGDTQVETYPIVQGTHFEQVATSSANVQMRAHGDWSGRPGSDISKFTIELTAHNLGHMLDAFGYAGVIDGGQTLAHIEGSWPGSPSTFALARLDGSLKVSMKDGRIPDADPGAGRLLGLFNLAAIPRRLAFDFGDLFKSGFSFDTIEGDFALKNGDAQTSNLVVKSPTADMRLSGRMGLKTKDWDQVVEVTPHVGGTLAVGGALVGGPVGAAAGMLLQGIFKNQINAATRAQYKITGSWDKPTVTVLAKENSTQKKPAQKPAQRSTAKPATPIADANSSGASL